MKIIASWPEYGHDQIVAVTEGGEVYALRRREIPDGQTTTREWIKVGERIGPIFVPSPHPSHATDNRIVSP